MKNNRDPFYGHKIRLSAGKSFLVFHCAVLEGNPADSTVQGLRLERYRDGESGYSLQILDVKHNNSVWHEMALASQAGFYTPVQVMKLESGNELHRLR